MALFEGDNDEVWHWDGFRLPAYPDASQIPGIEDPEIERLPQSTTNSLGHRHK